MDKRFIDWIWHIRGSVALAPGQTSDAAFARLTPLLHEPGTTHDRRADTLTFAKTDQAAQDKLSIFDRGVLQIERTASGAVLRYHLTSRALLFCFLAPLLFIGFAQLTVALGQIHKPPAADRTPKAKKTPTPLNPIDRALGAPAPDPPGKADAAKAAARKKKPSPTTGYVFAGIFAALYLVGRLLEDRLVRELFHKRLLS